LSANSSLSAAQVRDILRNSGNNSSTPDNLVGYGILDTEAAIEAAIEAAGGSIAPNASFAMLTDGATTVNLTDTSTDFDGTIVSLSWDFGDSNTSTLENPSHTYISDGTYTVALTVIDNEGLTDKVSRVVELISSSEPSSNSSGGGGSISYRSARIN